MTPSPENYSGTPSRRGGDRRETNDRVTFIVGTRRLEGWALNESSGGLRAIVDEGLNLGDEALVEISDKPARAGRVVWIQEEPDGAIVGFSFEDSEGSVPPPPPSPNG